MEMFILLEVTVIYLRIEHEAHLLEPCKRLVILDLLLYEMARDVALVYKLGDEMLELLTPYYWLFLQKKNNH